MLLKAAGRPLGVFALLSQRESGCRIRRTLGRIAARLLQIRGGAFVPAAATDQPCGRGLSRACVIKKNLAWSELGQYRCLNYGAFPAQGLQRKLGALSSKEGAGKAVPQGR